MYKGGNYQIRKELFTATREECCETTDATARPLERRVVVLQRIKVEVGCGDD